MVTAGMNELQILAGLEAGDFGHLSEAQFAGDPAGSHPDGGRGRRVERSEGDCRRHAGQPARNAPAGLTPREQQVLRGVLEGLTNKEIAHDIGVSLSSVKASLQQLFDKTGVRTRSQLVRIAIERSLETTSTP